MVVAGLVRRREVRHQAGQLEPLRALDGARDRARVIGVLRAQPAHAGVELHVHVGPHVLGARDLLEQRDERSSQATTSAAARARPRASSRVSAPITRIRARMPCLAELLRLGGGRHGQPVGAARRAPRARTRRRPCPYASAFTTAHRLRPAASSDFRWAQLRSIAPRSIRATARSGALIPTSPPGSRRSRRRRSRGSRRSSAAATRPARACASTPAAAASNGSIPFASSAPAIPESTSPVPAVASAGVAPGLTAAVALRERDDRVVALQHHDAAAALRRLARAGQPRGLDLVRLDLEQAAELALVRGQHGRRRPLAERLQPAGVRVQAVGVDQHRDRRAPRHLARPSRARRRPGRCPGPARRTRPLGTSPHLVGARRVVRAVLLGQPVRHRLQQPQLERSARSTPAPPPARSPRRCASRPSATIVGAPVSPREPPATTTTPDLNLSPARARGGTRSSTPSAISPARSGRRRAARDPDLDHPTRPACYLPGVDVEADLRPVERGRDVRLTASPSTSPVDAFTPDGTSQATTGAPASLIALIAPADRLARLALEAGPEHRVDDRARPLELLGRELARRIAGQAVEVRARVALRLGEVADGEHVHLASLLAQQPRDDQAVAAVVSLAAHDPDGPAPAHRGGRARQPDPGALHQVEPRDRPAPRSPRRRQRASQRPRRAGRASPAGSSRQGYGACA